MATVIGFGWIEVDADEFNYRAGDGLGSTHAAWKRKKMIAGPAEFTRFFVEEMTNP